MAKDTMDVMPKPEVKKEETVSVSDKKMSGVKLSAKESREGSAEVSKRADTKAGSPQVVIRCLWPDRRVVRNTPSGRVYIWARSGAETAVDKEDVEVVMRANQSNARGCCGSGRRPRIIFEIA